MLKLQCFGSDNWINLQKWILYHSTYTIEQVLLLDLNNIVGISQQTVYPSEGIAHFTP